MSIRALFPGWLALALLAPFTLNAQVYKWTDANGQVHYSDQPQSGENAPLSVAPAATSAPATSSAPAGDNPLDQQRKLLDAMTTERQQREEQHRQEQEARAQRERNCQIAQDRLRTYNDASSLYHLDESGERRTLSFGQRNAATEAAQIEVDKWCD